MTFNSVVYAAFLPVVVLVHWRLPHRGRTWLLVVASYVFYGAWDVRFLGLLWLSTAADYVVAGRLAAIDRAERTRRRRWLAVSLSVNLGILGTFKYLDFFVSEAGDLLGRVGLDAHPATLGLLLPVGISFYTFQTLGYTIDVYRGRLEPCRDPVLFAAFVAYFPQLVAGPIERARHLLPQLGADRPPPRSRQVESGLALILWGLVKKVVIADRIAFVADGAFDAPGTQGSAALVLGGIAFMIQIYSDFSGYTDIARGSSRLLGIELMDNFAQPFLSRSVSEAWRRWHISLSNWMRDYVFLPLLGRRPSEGRTTAAFLLTFTLVGLWHGAAWTFVLWGLANGVALVVERRLRITAVRGEALPTVREVPRVLLTSTVLGVLLTLFRSPDLSGWWDWVQGVVALRGPAPGAWWAETVAVMVAATLVMHVVERRRSLGHRLLEQPGRRGVAAGLALLAIVLSSGAATTPFVYFQF